MFGEDVFDEDVGELRGGDCRVTRYEDSHLGKAVNDYED